MCMGQSGRRAYGVNLASAITAIIANAENLDLVVRGGSVDLEVNAKNYLQPMLHIGDSSTNVMARFGLPISQYETGMHELCMYFMFSDTNHAATLAGVGGFTGFFTNNQLSHWEPIYKR